MPLRFMGDEGLKMTIEVDRCKVIGSFSLNSNRMVQLEARFQWSQN